jgi:hypothetical protein
MPACMRPSAAVLAAVLGSIRMVIFEGSLSYVYIRAMSAPVATDTAWDFAAQLPPPLWAIALAYATPEELAIMAATAGDPAALLKFARVSPAPMAPNIAVAAARTGQLHVLAWLWGRYYAPLSSLREQTGQSPAPDAILAPIVGEIDDPRSIPILLAAVQHGIETLTVVHPECDAHFRLNHTSVVKNEAGIFHAVLRCDRIVAAALSHRTRDVWDYVVTHRLVEYSWLAFTTGYCTAHNAETFTAIHIWGMIPRRDCIYFAALEYAAAGNLELLQLSREHTRDAMFRAIPVAAGYGHFEAMKWCIAHAAGTDDYSIAGFRGIDGLTDAIREAHRIGSRVMIDWFQSIDPYLVSRALDPLTPDFIGIGQQIWDRTWSMHSLFTTDASAQRFMELARTFYR